MLASKCDFLIQNDNQQSIVKQALEIHKKLLDLSEDNIPFLQ